MLDRLCRLVAVLPMKAHSERIPGKNFKSFAGKPLFRWILDTLLSIEEIERVIINTDGRELIESHGGIDDPRVLMRERSADLRGDLVSMNLVIADDLANVPACMYLMTHTTNPLLSGNTIRDAVAAFRRAREGNSVDSLFSVNRLQSRFYDANAHPINHDPTNLIRTQDLEPWFEENSNLYLFTRESFERTHARIGERPMMYVTPGIESVDVDDEESWRLAESIAHGLGSLQ